EAGVAVEQRVVSQQLHAALDQRTRGFAVPRKSSVASDQRLELCRGLVRGERSVAVRAQDLRDRVDQTMADPAELIGREGERDVTIIVGGGGRACDWFHRDLTG